MNLRNWTCKIKRESYLLTRDTTAKFQFFYIAPFTQNVTALTGAEESEYQRHYCLQTTRPPAQEDLSDLQITSLPPMLRYVFLAKEEG